MRLLVLRVHAVYAGPQQGSGHLDRHARTRTRLVKQVKEPLADKCPLEATRLRSLQFEAGWKQHALEPLAGELARVQNVLEHPLIVPPWRSSAMPPQPKLNGPQREGTWCVSQTCTV